MQSLQDHFQVLLTFHYIGAHDKSPSLLDDLLVDFGIVSRCVYIILGLVQLLFQFELNLSFLNELLMELGFPSVVGSSDIFLLLGFLLLELFQLTFGL